MENFLDFLRQFGERFKELSQGKKVAALSLLALALASLLVMSFWLKTRQKMVALFGHVARALCPPVFGL